MVVNELQFSKDQLSISVNEAGSSILVSDLQFANAPLPIEVTDEDNLMLSNDEHPENVL
jgi:hypothetical protein